MNQIMKIFNQNFLLVFLSFVIVLLRYPDFILKPRFWAEESIYFETFNSVESAFTGFNAILYPSYYVLLSRISAFLASLVSLENAPLVHTLIGLFVILIPIIIIATSDFHLWKDIKTKVYLAAFLILSCSTGEIWLNSTNLGFIIPISTFLILLDDTNKTFIRKTFYSLILFVGSLTGPITLMMSPFFLFRLFKNRNSESLIYCGVLLVGGILHLSYFFISTSLETNVLNVNRGIFSEDYSITEFLIYLFSPNIIFPVFGYFISLFTRHIYLAINNNEINLDFLNFILGEGITMKIETILYEVPALLIFLNLIFLITLIIFLIGVYRNLEGKEKIYFGLIFIYLSSLITLLSLGGHGGFRYSYLTSFIFIFAVYIASRRSKLFFYSILVNLSIIIGALEYYPRVISFVPDYALNNQKWPSWNEEIDKWSDDINYNVLVWPYVKDSIPPFPDRDDIWNINLSNPSTWKESGGFLYTEELMRVFNNNE